MTTHELVAINNQIGGAFETSFSIIKKEKKGKERKHHLILQLFACLLRTSEEKSKPKIAKRPHLYFCRPIEEKISPRPFRCSCIFRYLFLVFLIPTYMPASPVSTHEIALFVSVKPSRPSRRESD